MEKQNNFKLFMVLIGCKPKGRLTEQHDIFFGIANSLKELIPEIEIFWPEAKNNFHVDAWREISVVDGFSIEIVDKNYINANNLKLFFVNLGGYKPNEFEEFHYKKLVVANSLAEAQKKSKEIFFYKDYSFSGAVSHIDDKFAIDVDDIYNVEDLLTNFKLKFSQTLKNEDLLNIGYLKKEKI